VMGGISGAVRQAGEACAGAVSTVAAGAVGLKSGRLRMTPSRAAAALLGAVVLAVLVISLAVRAAGCSRTDADAAPAVSAADNGRLIIVREPPAPYAD